MNEVRRGISWGWWLAVVAALGIACWVLLSARRVYDGHPYPQSCIGNLRRLGLAMLDYTNDWDDRFPVLVSTKQCVHEDKAWTDALLQYLKDDRFLRCPNSSRDRLSYALNRRLSGWPADPRDIDRPAETVLIYETVNDRRENNNLNGDSVWSHRDGGMPQSGQCVRWDGPVEEYTERWPRWAKPRHLDTNNIVFTDGHAKAADPSYKPQFDPKAQEETKP